MRLDLLDATFLSRLCGDVAGRVSVLVPNVPTTTSLVKALGSWSGRRVHALPRPGHRRPTRAANRAGISRWARGGRVDHRARAGIYHVLGRAALRGGAGGRPGRRRAQHRRVEGLLKGLDTMGWSWSRLPWCLDALASMRSSAASRSPPTSRSSWEEEVTEELDLDPLSAGEGQFGLIKLHSSKSGIENGENGGNWQSGCDHALHIGILAKRIFRMAF
ncbi:hypothetical protein EE612_026766 [Oryza sativa]|nr:hypothetical protein EE612_026766 [Oryza sativa]